MKFKNKTKQEKCYMCNKEDDCIYLPFAESNKDASSPPKAPFCKDCANKLNYEE